MTDLLDEEGRNEAERRFLRVLVGVAPGFDVWTYYPQLVTTVVVCDPDTPVVLRTLRVDFDGTSIRCGHDPRGQIDPAMASNDPDGYECRDALTPEQFAEVAGEWFWRQFRRPIDRYEWRGRVELTRFPGHLILGVVPGEGGPDGSSSEVPRGVPA